MKKLFISLMTVGTLLTSCANFDEPTAKTFAAGPSVDVKVSAVADSTFTFTVTPASGANYYTYVVREESETQEIDGETLLKDQVEGIISQCNTTSKVQTVTVNMRDDANTPLAKPNTSYVIYAVAASSDGIPGNVAAVQVNTTDKVCPFISNSSASENDVTLVYNEEVVRGNGKISAQYYVEWSNEYIDIPADSIRCDVNGNYVILSAGKVPANCYVLLTLETGAFKDNAGNASEAAGWGVSKKTGAFTGICYKYTAGTLIFEESNIVTPVPGVLSDASQPIVIDFGQNVYSGTNKNATIKIIYEGAGTGKTTTYEISSDKWSISGQTLTFTLPAIPDENDLISFDFGSGIVADVYGNENVETLISSVYKYSTVSWKEIGTYTYNYSILVEGSDTQPIYQNEMNPNQYKMTHWGGDVDFIFNVADDGTITFDEFASGLYPSYGAVYIYDMNTRYGSNYAPSKYDASTGVFSFNLLYYFVDKEWYYYDQTGSAPETMTISASAAKTIAKSMSTIYNKIMSLNKKNFSYKAPKK